MLTNVLAVSVLTTSALAQSSYFTGLVDTLRNNGLTTLTDLLGSFDNSTLSAVEAALSTGNHTVFAPNNDAFASLTGPLNTTQLGPVLAYHLLSGAINTNDTSPDKLTIARSSLNGPPLVNLPGNQSQVVVLSETPDGHLTVVDAADNKNITSSASVKYQNLQIEVIPSVLTIPGNVTATFPKIAELSTLVTTADSVDPNLHVVLSETKGVTIFAPVNSAFTSQIGSVAPADVKKILLNHVINGTVAYSSQITNGMKVTTAGGSTLTFATNSTGVFVTAANSTARITRTDILLSNGVVHLIDHILLDTTFNPSAASSAVNSATSVQGTQSSTQTGPVTATGGAYKKMDVSVVVIAMVGLGAFLA